MDITTIIVFAAAFVVAFALIVTAVYVGSLVCERLDAKSAKRPARPASFYSNPLRLTGRSRTRRRTSYAKYAGII